MANYVNGGLFLTFLVFFGGFLAVFGDFEYCFLEILISIREMCVFKLTEFSPSNRSPTHPLEILKVFSVKNAVKWFFTPNF